MSEILRLPGKDVEIRYPRGHLPKHEGKELSVDDLRIFYTCINHVKRDDGSPLTKEEFRGIIGIKLGKPGTAIPIPVTKLGDPKYPWTKELAKSVERDEWRQELLLRIALLQYEGTERIEAARAASRGKINLKPYEQLPFLVLEYGAKSTQLSEVQVQEIYAGMCWYEFERKTLDKPDQRTLTALLAGVKDVVHFRNFPRWVTSFIQCDNDPFTVEVRRAATLNKDALLRKVDAVWQHHLHPNRPIGYEVAGLMRARPSVSTSSPVVTENPSRGFRSPVLSNRPEPTHRSTHEGHENLGSAFDAPIPSPLTGGGNAIGQPLSYPEYDHAYEDTTLSQLSESFQAQAGLAPYEPRPTYQQQGSYRSQPSDGLQSSDEPHSSFGLQSTFGPPSSFEQESLYPQQVPYQQQAPSEPQSSLGQQYGYGPQSSFGSQSTYPQQAPVEPQPSYEPDSSYWQQFPQPAPFNPQTPPNRAYLAPSEGKTPLSSSSGRSASPTRAATKRQEEEGKSRRKAVEGGSQRKADKDVGKKPKESRHKKSVERKSACSCSWALSPLLSSSLSRVSLCLMQVVQQSAS